MKYSSQSMHNEKVHVAWMRKQKDSVFDIATLYTVVFQCLGETIYHAEWGGGGGKLC